MQLFCRSCGAEIKSADINLNNMMAKCAQCNAVFSFADMYDDVAENPAKRKRDYAYDVPQPGNITVRHDGMDLLITRAWSRKTGLGLLLFAILWGGVVFGAMLPSFFASDQQSSIEVFVCFFGIFAGAGVLVTGIAIYSLVNFTTIRVSREAIQTRHHPLPWPGKVFSAPGVEQVFVRQVVSTSRNKNGSTSTSISYNVELVLSNGSRQPLLTGLEDADQGRFIEQEVEKYLQMEDVPVAGEYGSTGWL
jgi:hypothetical protein